MIEKLPPFNTPGNYYPDDVTDKINELVDVVNDWDKVMQTNFGKDFTEFLKGQRKPKQ